MPNLVNNRVNPTQQWTLLDGGLHQDAAIQCELLLDNLHGRTHEFDIKDLTPRRKLVRRLYFSLMFQIVLVIPCLELCFLYPQPFNRLPIRPIYFVIIIALYSWLYICRTWRRSAPFNYLIYLLTSITTPISTSLYLMNIEQKRWLHLYPLMLIIELLVLVIYTKQQRFKFSHAIGVIIIYLVYGLFLLLAYFLNAFFKVLFLYGCTLEAWYIVYDTHLMMCGVHGYNMRPKEYIYGACNIHADLPKFLWVIIRHFLFGPLMGFIRLLRNCRSNQIC